MKIRERWNMVFLADLQAHSVREVCQGAAEYAAERPDLDFNPWPVLEDAKRVPSPSDLLIADCIVGSEEAITQVYGHLRNVRLPTVFFLADTPNHKIPSVGFDEEAIGKMAAEHLLSRGYRHLAFIGSSDKLWSQFRAKGFKEIANSKGVSIKSYEFPLDILPVYWSWKLSKQRAGLHRLLISLPKSCGIFAANDVIACFLIETARFCGVRVPEDVGVLGVDDDPIPNAAAGLAISSVNVSFREIGRCAAEIVDQRMRGKSSPLSIRLPPTQVVVRTSTNSFTVEDPLVKRAQAYIESHRNNRLKVEDVVKAVATTRMTLGKHFRQHLNVSVLDYILQRRMEHAKDLLRKGDLNVNEVAESCGFHNAPFFCSVFKRLTGMNPGKLRKEAKGRS